MIKSKHLIGGFIVSCLAIGFFILPAGAFAQTGEVLSNIKYPIKELGNCKDKASCSSYCDKTENGTACIAFAEKNNLMSEEEIKMAKSFMSTGAVGPGGCKGKDECSVYCDDIAHINECIAFAEKNNLMSAKDLEEAKKIQTALDKGVKPPACKNKKECDTYCEDSSHMEECINFGIAAGFIQGKELEDSQKMLAALKRGVKPLPCKGKEACDTYCNSPDNMETCISFAMEVGFMSEKEKEDSQKMLSALKKGVKPPNCKGKDECDTYCSQEDHFEECLNFSEAAGFMNSEEAAMARKTGGKGPGGCKGKDECDAFCNNPDNQETCFNFAKDNGMISEEDLKKIEEGKQRFKESLDQAPQAVIDCLNSQVGSDLMEKFKSGAAMPPKDIGDKMQICFGSMGPGVKGEPGSGGMIPPAGQTGPGGCKNAEECKLYCESNPDECQKFQSGPGEMNPGNQMMPQQSGPGGCKTPEECKSYCESHSDECQKFQSGPGEMNPGNQMMPQQSGPKECKDADCKNSGGGQQFAPGTSGGQQGAPGFEGGQRVEVQGGCKTPEECQQMQQNMAPLQTCQGENCLSSPPPGQYVEPSLPGNNNNPMPQVQLAPQQPLVENVPPPQQPNETPPPSL